MCTHQFNGQDWSWIAIGAKVIVIQMESMKTRLKIDTYHNKDFHER